MVMVEHIVLDSQAPSGSLGFETPSLGQCAAALGLVAGVAIGDGDELDQVSQLGELSGSARRTDVAVVGMSAESDDMDLVVLGQHDSGAGQEKQQEFTHGNRL